MTTTLNPAHEALTPPAAPAASAGGGGTPPEDENVSYRALILTTALCVVFAVAGHLIVWWAYNGQQGDPRLPWQPVVGAALAGVAIIAFGGFYATSRRIRSAIAACFLLTFIVVLTFALTINQFADNTQAAGALDLVQDFRTVVLMVVGFYFTGEAAVGVTKVLAAKAVPGATAAQIRRADRDFVGDNR